MTDFMEDLLTKAKAAAVTAGKVAEEMVDTSKLKLREAKLSSDIKAAYQRLGNLVYDAMKNGKDNSQVVEMTVAELDQLLRERAELRTSGFTGAARQVSCPQCSALNNQEFTFCSKCGVALYQKFDQE